MSLSSLALSATLLTAAVRAAQPQSSGAELFSAHGCQACHRIGRLGGNTGPDLSFVGVRRTKDWLDRWLADPQSWKHSTLMPNLRLSKGSREALAAYLSARKGQDFGEGAKPWDALRATPLAAGAAIYRKAGCIACHGAGGAGGEPNVNVPGDAIPALRELVYTYTTAELKAKIARGVRPDKRDPAGQAPVAMPAWSAVLNDSELDALVAYLQTFKPSSGERSF